MHARVGLDEAAQLSRLEGERSFLLEVSCKSDAPYACALLPSALLRPLDPCSPFTASPTSPL